MSARWRSLLGRRTSIEYAATKGAKEPVYVSPFVGRLDDRGDDGMGVVAKHQEDVPEG